MFSRSIAASALIIGILLPCSALLCAQAPSAESGNPWNAVEQALGRTGKLQPGDVYKFGMPRSDMHVTVDGVRLRPPGAWLMARFQKDGKRNHGHGRPGPHGR